MGLRFRKSFKVAPGVRVNIGKKSAGVSIGGKGGGVSINSKTGAHGRVSIPGTGISYHEKIGGGNKKKSSSPSASSGNKSFHKTEFFLDEKTLSSLNEDAFLAYSHDIVESAKQASSENYDDYMNELRMIREEASKRENRIPKEKSRRVKKNRNVLMWILLIFIPPIGIIYMWVSKKEFSMKKKIILSVIFAVWFLIAMLMPTEQSNPTATALLNNLCSV